MEKIILYGAGQRGKTYLNYLKYLGLESSVLAFCDMNADAIKERCGKAVLRYEEAKKLNASFVVSVAREAGDEVRSVLEGDHQDCYELAEWLQEVAGIDRVKFNRDYCALFHVDSMDEYFHKAESKDNLNVFWGGAGVFYPMFQQLDLHNVIELACGRGRHVSQYIEKAGQVTLVDILEKNIDFCKERFAGYTNISYLKNNGSDFDGLSDNSYTALFTYDAMVHFEMMDIYHYLLETYRVLIPGGKALFHHSNNDSDYKASFGNAPHGRSFMSKTIFAYLAYRAGFEIVDQHVIDWGLLDNFSSNLDCVTLVQKPFQARYSKRL